MNHILHQFWIKHRNHFLQLVDVIAVLVAVIGCFIILEFSADANSPLTRGLRIHLASMPWQFILLNILTIWVLWVVFYLITNRTWLANVLLCVCCSIISVCNHYVTLFHGMPLSFLSLRNFATAMNVLGGYTFTINSNLSKLLILIAIILLGCVIHFLLMRKIKCAARGGANPHPHPAVSMCRHSLFWLLQPHTCKAQKCH